MDPTKQPGIRIAQIFLDSVQFSHREDSVSMAPDTKAHIGEVDVGIEVGERIDGKLGVVKVTISTKEESKPVYNMRLEMRGIFTVPEDAANLPMGEFLKGGAVSLIYPFVREAFASVTGRGRFGPIWLDPFNTLRAAAGFRSVPNEEPGQAEPAAAPPSKE